MAGDRSKYPVRPPKTICPAKPEYIYGGCGVLRIAPIEAEQWFTADSPKKLFCTMPQGFTKNA